MRDNNPFEISKLIHATTTVGFFYAVDHGVDTSCIRNEANEFFNLAPEEKQKIHLSQSPHYRGYTLIDEEVTKGIPDHKETLDLAMEEKAEPERLEDWMVMRGPNQFPEKMPGMQKKVEEYMKAVGSVGHIIMQSYAKGLNLDEDYFA